MTEHSSSALVEAPWVNPRDPAKAVGPDGKPARSRRAPIWADVPDEQWDDWRWQLSHRINSLDEVANSTWFTNRIGSRRERSHQCVSLTESS